MKMNFFFGNIFWGILLVLWGTSLILKTFNINMPLAKIFIALIIILFGVRLLIGSSKPLGRNISGKGSYYRSNSSGDYSMIFSSGTIDLRDISEKSRNMEITVVFGNATVILPAHLSFDIEPTSVFGATILPDKSQYGFGANQFSKDGEGNRIHIESTSVFGRLEYIFEDVGAPVDSTINEENTHQDGADF